MTPRDVPGSFALEWIEPRLHALVDAGTPQAPRAAGGNEQPARDIAASGQPPRIGAVAA